jgi:hypothetical protein|tara:strand:- start:83 stop:913 length:831 start_codon:yes stop_codon:yes gene_type:complete
VATTEAWHRAHRAQRRGGSSAYAPRAVALAAALLGVNSCGTYALQGVLGIKIEPGTEHTLLGACWTAGDYDRLRVRDGGLRREHVAAVLAGRGLVLEKSPRHVTFDSVITTKNRVVVVDANIVLPDCSTARHTFVWNGWTRHLAWSPECHYVLTSEDIESNAAGVALRRRLSVDVLKIERVAAASAVLRATPSDVAAPPCLPARVVLARDNARAFVANAGARRRALRMYAGTNTWYPVRVNGVGGESLTGIRVQHVGDDGRCKRESIAGLSELKLS